MTIATIAGGLAAAQTDVAPTDVGQGESILNAAEAEFRELMFTRAVDFSDPNQELAIRYVIKRNEPDARFNEVARNVLQEMTKDDGGRREELLRAVDLLPLSTISPEEQTQLAFECYLKCNPGDDLALMQKLEQRLKAAPDGTSRLVKQRMSSGGYPTALLSLVTIVGASTEGVLPLLNRLAKSNDPELAAIAMQQMDELIERLRRIETRKLNEQRQALTAGELDPKLLKYAERIVSRYDTDGDRRLAPSEQKKMLLSPVQADTDQDGVITVQEYAWFLKSRQPRAEKR
jgi:hypothetical protein